MVHPYEMQPSPLAELAQGRPLGQGILLGVGRSGFVFKTTDAEGRAVARKVFDSNAFNRAIQYAFLGSANPYAWNHDAVRCAFLRRNLAADLVELWFEGKLRVARALDAGWNEEYRAYELVCELVPGRAPALHHPLNRSREREVDELHGVLMPKLRAHLSEAGFEGALWQAGLGNPVALSNFLLEEDVAGVERRWAWIDLESGVPALFPAYLPSLWRFYLPRAVRLGRPLFDDVDTSRLARYVAAHAADIDARLGTGSAERMRSEVAALEVHQRAWKSQPRLERSLGAAISKNRIDAERAAFYRRRPLRWYAREALRGVRGVLVRARRWSMRKWGRVYALPWRKIAFGMPRFLISQTFRARLARGFVAHRIESWQRRGQLTASEAESLRERLEAEDSSSYLTDFGVHVAIKPIVKTAEWAVLPTLFATGRVDEATLGLGILLGGCLARTAYTLGRMIQAWLVGHELPWIALWTGALPVVGNLAYPLQIVSSSRDGDDVLAQFILYDGCTAIGARMPIWGGRDTLSEHLMNHVPDRIVDGKRK
ncbi:MAG: hypothetical protein GY711_18325 [bacterium]|nr:hypothetical protein [bacterium]